MVDIFYLCHVLRVLHALSIYSMISHPGWQDSTTLIHLTIVLKKCEFSFCLSSSVVFYNYEPATSMPTLIHLSFAPISFLSSQPPLISTQASCNVRTHRCIISEMYIHIIFVFIKGTSILHTLKWTIAKTQRCIRSEMYTHIIIVLIEDTNIRPLTWNGQY